MKIGLNREYALRHLGVAALFACLALWFLYDAVFVYPNLPPDGGHHTTVAFQYSAAALLAAVSAVVALRVFLASRETLEWSNGILSGTIVGRDPVFMNNVRIADRKLWERKNILRLVSSDGRVMDVDGWHHTGVDELAKALEEGK